MERLGVIKSVFRQKLHVVKMISEKTLTQQHLDPYCSKAKNELLLFPSSSWLSSAFLWEGSGRKRVVWADVGMGNSWETIKGFSLSSGCVHLPVKLSVHTMWLHYFWGFLNSAFSFNKIIEHMEKSTYTLSVCSGLLRVVFSSKGLPFFLMNSPYLCQDSDCNLPNTRSD